MADMVFKSLRLREVSIQIEDDNYVLIAAKGAAAIKWKGQHAKSVRVNIGGDDQVATIDSAQGADEILLSECLFKVSTTGRTPVSYDTLVEWPQEIVRELIDKLKEISKLGAEGSPDVLRKRIARDTRRLKELEEKEREKECATRNGITEGNS